VVNQGPQAENLEQHQHEKLRYGIVVIATGSFSVPSYRNSQPMVGIIKKWPIISNEPIINAAAIHDGNLGSQPDQHQ
jgi:hypothetical protein